jgi:hypothetical protein
MPRRKRTDTDEVEEEKTEPAATDSADKDDSSKPETPAEAEAKLVEAKKEGEEKPQKPSGLVGVNARQFMMARKVKPWKMAGFLHHIKHTKGLGHRRTVKEWQPIWEAYMARPVGQKKRGA